MNEKHIISLIGFIHREADKFLENQLKKHNILGIAPSHGDILFNLYKYKSLTMQQLAKLIDRDKSTVTVLVNKLVELGYISKTPDLEDARVYNIAITEKGQELRPVFEEISKCLLAKVYDDFTLEEQTLLLKMLQRIKF